SVRSLWFYVCVFFFFQAEDGIRDLTVTGVQTCALPILAGGRILATGGVTEMEGAGGGGIVPWALIAGYGTRDEIGATAFYTYLRSEERRVGKECRFRWAAYQ